MDKKKLKNTLITKRQFTLITTFLFTEFKLFIFFQNPFLLLYISIKKIKKHPVSYHKIKYFYFLALCFSP
jgi:hypothetical protein